MKKLAVALSIGMLAGVWGFAQGPVRVYTSPKLPPRDSLSRMNLVMAWNTRLAIDSNRDGIFSVQVIPSLAGAQVVAQTYAGRVYLFDADSGDLLWKTQPGTPYWTSQPVAYNSQSIFVARRNMLHVLNRTTGAQRVYTFDAKVKENVFGYAMQSAPSAGLVADEDMLTISMSDMVQAFVLPDFDRIEQLKAARARGDKDAIKILHDLFGDADLLDSPQPVLRWSYRIAPDTTEFPPLVYADRVSILTGAGELTSVNRFERGPRVELFEFKMRGRVLGPAAQYNNFGYVGSDDANLYAFDLYNGRLAWRHVSGAPIVRGPAANDRDVYVTLDRLGLRLVDRASGREVWTNANASRFLAANDKFVYALDKFGMFFVLDAVRGSTLAKYDLGDWRIAVANEWTDRVYLAANDGQLMCLRGRELARPLTMKTMEVLKKPEPRKAVAPKKEEMKEDMKDEKKDDEKVEKKKKDDDKLDKKKKDDNKDDDKADMKKKDDDKKKKDDNKDDKKKDDKKDARQWNPQLGPRPWPEWTAPTERDHVARQDATAADDRRRWALL